MTDDTAAPSTSFYTGTLPEQPGDSSLVYFSDSTSDVQTLPTAHTPQSQLQNIATSPQLEPGDELELLRPLPARQRQRSNSAPGVLYQQVALQLRDISDELNREYSHEEVQKKFIFITD